MLMLLREMEDHPVHSMPNYDFLSGSGYQMKPFGHRISDRDSSSTKSGHQEASGMSESSLNGQHTPTQSDNDDSRRKHEQDTMKSVLSLGNPEASFSSPNLSYSQPFAGIPYTYTADAHYGGVLTGYASHAIVQPQINGTANPRVPLPVEPAAEVPIFVNPKQYHAILRRRQVRAKMEAQNKLVKGRKPYLHESRHLHALKRARGLGGRFLNTKQPEEQKQQPPVAASFTKVLGKNLGLENGPTFSPSTPTSSDITSVSTSGRMLAHQDRVCFSSANFVPTINLSIQNGAATLAVSGVHHHASIMR